jgi:hypothetical protein
MKIIRNIVNNVQRIRFYKKLENICRILEEMLEIVEGDYGILEKTIIN